MLDSTGLNSTVTVTCGTCPRHVFLETYRPQHGHDGCELPQREQGPYFDMIHARGPLTVQVDRMRFKEGILLTVEEKEDTELNTVLQLTRAQIVNDHSLYSYGNARVPVFGIGPGKILWICQMCRTLFDDDPRRIQAEMSLKESIYLQYYQERHPAPSAS